MTLLSQIKDDNWVISGVNCQSGVHTILALPVLGPGGVRDAVQEDDRLLSHVVPDGPGWSLSHPPGDLAQHRDEALLGGLGTAEYREAGHLKRSTVVR